MTTSPQIPIKQIAQVIIHSIFQNVNGVKAVVIATVDGFEVAARVENTAQVTRLSALSSSLAALGVLAGEESHLGGCEDIVIEASAGNLLVIQFRRNEETFIMSIILSKSAIMGQALYFSRKVARQAEHMA